MDKLSYAIGLSIAEKLINAGVEDLTFVDFLDGVQTVFTKAESKLSPEQANQILTTYFDKKNKEEMIRQALESERNLKAGQDFLEKNKENPGVKWTASGLQYKVIKEGDGKHPTVNSRVKCHYAGRLIDDTEFDSSYKRGEPATFGLGQVIPGWTEGLQLMKVGSQYEFYIPAELGYGERGIPGHIPGNSVLIFVVELLDVE